MLRKLLKILGILTGVVLLLLFLAPFLFKGTLEDLLKKNINKNLNATVSWEAMDLSLFKNFPNAAVTIKDFSVINHAPFEGDTLASGSELRLNMGLRELFKRGEEPVDVRSLLLDEALVNIVVDSLGNANYDIGKKDENAGSEEETTSEDQGFTFSLQKYEIRSSEIRYQDDASQLYFLLKDFNHEGKGDLSAATSTLETQTNTLATFRIDDIEYLSDNALALDADFEMDLENQKYTFLENEARINELPLTFNGFVQVLEDGSNVDVTFETPSSDFKNFLAVIPRVYVKEIKDVQTTGNFEVNGAVKGLANEERIPTLDIHVASDNASFKYPDLPKAVRNISIDARLKNDTGLAKDTYLTIGGVTFKVDDEIFTANGSIYNLTENALVNLALKGTLNLANIEQVLPLELEQDLTGVFKADVTSRFDMRSIENEQYERIESTGTARLTDFNYSDPAFNNPIEISVADADFKPGTITLNSFEAKTGTTDVSATGDIENLIPWIMAKQDLKGRFAVQSETFNLNDFMTSEVAETTESDGTRSPESAEEAIKIPDFLDATLDFTANKVIYDNVELDQASGTVTVREETAYLQNVKSQIFGGDVAFSGNVSTLNETPTFSMNLDLQKVDIASSFQALSLLKYLAPVAQALDGDLNTTLELSGQLDDNLVPDLKTLAGNALAQVLTAEINAQNAPVLSQLDQQLPFLRINQLSLQDVGTALTFDNGNIEVAPFEFEVEDVKVRVSGRHGLDKTMDYNASVDVPARLMGSEVTRLLQKLDPKDAEEMTVAIPIGVSGTITNPAVNVNTESAVGQLTQKIIDKQKEELQDKGINILEDLIGGGSAKDSTSVKNDSTTTQQTTDVIKDIFGGLFKKKKKDSTDNNN